jgi:DNA transformation protein and related proteins
MSDAKLLNIGPKSAAWLRQVGVRTFDDLKQHGAVGVFLKVKRAGFRPSLNLLYALAGAELGCHWTALTAEQKNALIVEVNAWDDAQAQAKKKIMPVREYAGPASVRESSDESAEGAGSMGDPGLFESVDHDEAPSEDRGGDSNEG